jgi:GxxExxY protein
VLEQRALTERIIGLAIEVHRVLGPGLLESVYTECLCLELVGAGIPHEREVGLPVRYKNVDVPLGFRADIVVDLAVIIEVKAVAALTAAHESQLRTYLRLSGLRVGLLLNFHESTLRASLRRFIV